TYSYASAGGTPLVDGVTPARTIGFLFRGSLLVGYQFVSSFRDDHTDFDESRVKDIRKGETTEAQVQAMLGRPAGFVRYPIVKEETHRSLVYMYTQVKGSAFNLKVHIERLVVDLAPNGVVADVQFDGVKESVFALLRATLCGSGSQLGCPSSTFHHRAPQSHVNAAHGSRSSDDRDLRQARALPPACHERVLS